MALVKCADCHNDVSNAALNCVHCGKPLIAEKPGAIGAGVRLVYGLFCVIVVLITIMATAGSARTDPAAAIFIPFVGAGIWFIGSVSAAVLLYVTRGGRLERIPGSTVRSGIDQSDQSDPPLFRERPLGPAWLEKAN